MVIAPSEMLLRMAVGIIAGGAIGYERERSGHVAGLRTHLLVGLASTLFMLVSTQFYYFQLYEKTDLIATDPSRIAASVVTGIGFLGTGAILRTGLSIQGLTTAASLWLVGALGLAAGGGMYLETAAATIVSLIVLIVLRRVENNHGSPLLRRAELKLDNPTVRDQIIGELQAIGVSVVEVEYQRDFKTNESGLLLDLHLSDENALTTILTCMEAIPDVRSLKIQRPIR
ncbi:MAG: MgtC/SapB family protein [Pirellulales bacterium]|nr:MgtC/SapB family protein [Pirellulales bacterium]